MVESTDQVRFAGRGGPFRAGPRGLCRTSRLPSIASGLPPTHHITAQAEPIQVVKALYDYEATQATELTVKEDEILNVYGKDDEWLLVSSPEEEGRVGYVPGNYVEEVCILCYLYLVLTRRYWCAGGRGWGGCHCSGDDIIIVDRCSGLGKCIYLYIVTNMLLLKSQPATQTRTSGQHVRRPCRPRRRRIQQSAGRLHPDMVRL